MAQAELIQVAAFGRGIGADGIITEATRQRALVTSQFVKSNFDNIVSVDFSGNHSCYEEAPVSGTEGRGMEEAAIADHMPTVGLRVDVDDEIIVDDTMRNFLVGLWRGHLDPELSTRIATHGDHWPRVEFLKNLAMPRAPIRPILVEGGYTRGSQLKERAMLAGYRHVMRNVQPGDLNAIERANRVVRRAAMSVLIPNALGPDISLHEKAGYMWDLLRGEG